MDIKAEVYSYIKQNEGTSYAELENLFTRLGFNWKGNLEIYSDVCDNVIFWTGWNKEAIELINDLQREDLISKVPGQPFIYYIDGKALNLPIVRKNIQYKTPHWLPVLFTARRKSLKQIIKEVEQEVNSYEGN
jgi:hypothetical protein